MSQTGISKDPIIDEKLYSRQIYAIGLDAMKKLAMSSVLISGMGGLGVEIAKNVILAGVKNVTIHDTRNTTIRDLASNFYLTEESINKNRALESYQQLLGLNEYVSVNVKTDELSDSFLKNFQCVVITDYHRESEIKRISSFCHQNNIKLILTETRGVFAYIFDDFGTNFIITDPTGEPPSTFLLSFITNSQNAKVTSDEGEFHNLCDGDHVTFEEVEGMTELNGREYEVKVINNRQFTIGDTTKFGAYTSEHRSGYGRQIILPKKIDFLEFTDALKNSEKTITIPFDYCTIGQDAQVILSFISAMHHMDKIKEEKSEVSYEDLLISAKEVNEEYHIVDEIDEGIIREFARESGSVICPSCAVFGGIAGQKVIKSVSGKLGPIYQFLAMGYTSSVPKNVHYELKNDRYDPYRIVFGNEQQEAMEKLRYFMIGAGALGCEQLKNWALMGVATRDQGQIYVTDMDSIEKSNLNRQFLFRNSDIGKMKSDVAARAVRMMNNSIRIESQQNKLCAETENIYNESFYEHLDGVCNALDNVETRLFSDEKCVFYDKPLLESGTLGSMAHYQIVVPHLTESYGSQMDMSEAGIPTCTIRNFPSNIDHCCVWGRDQFCGLFEQGPQSVALLLKDPTYIEKLRQKNKRIELETSLLDAKNYFINERCDNFNDCIKWARITFEKLFNYKIRDLQHQFPKDYIYKGLPFWTGNKRYPEPATFDANNKYHAEFVTTAAILRARVCGIQPEKVNIPEIASKVDVKKWEPSGSKISLDDEKEAESILDEDSLDKLINEIKPYLEKYRDHPPKAEEFEKDDDSNGHIDFIESSANIRAMNYSIEPKDKLEIKRIAGKIIPAIATTTAMICGLVALEMYKVHSVEGNKKLSDFRFGSINLALPDFIISEPRSCKYTECSANKIKFSLWDKWIIEGDLTIGEFINTVKDKYKINVDMMTFDKRLLYPVFGKVEETKKRLDIKITTLIKDLLSEENKYLVLICNCTDDDENDVETPLILLHIK